MKYQFNIPKKINVGFQNRADTYTGKLAYVVYTDDKGVLRKEKSWSYWRDDKIPALEFDNVPTEGFVLNKKVGETRWGWNPRKAWVRIYDPRDFEFEISVSNLIFILEECSSLKGKGLEGEFVYAWDKAELLLLPVTSLEYKESLAFKKAVENKVTKEDMKEGLCYLTKNNEEVLYLGRLPHWDFHESWSNETTEYKNQKRHVFLRIRKKNSWDDKYLIQSGFKQILSKIGDDPAPNFPNEYDKYMKKFGQPPVALKAKKDTGGRFTKHNGEYYLCREYYTGWNSQRPKYRRAATPVRLKAGKSVIYSIDTVNNWHDVDADNIYRLFIVNELGKEIELR